MQGRPRLSLFLSSFHIVGASIARPCGHIFVFAKTRRESVHPAARTANSRPYIEISQVKQTNLVKNQDFFNIMPIY